MLLAVIPALGLAAYTYQVERQILASHTKQEALRLARLASAEQQRLIEETRTLLGLLSQLREIRSGDPAACGAFLAGLLKQYPRYANFGLAAPNGRVVCSGLPLAREVNVSDRHYFRLAIETRGFSAGEYQVGRITGAGYPLLTPREVGRHGISPGAER